MVEKYTSNFRSHTSSSPKNQIDGDVVLLTGSTGALGANILAKLAESPDVFRVYAFNRKAADGTSLYQRQATALADRGLDAGILGGGRVVLVEGDLGEAGLGINQELYQEVSYIVFCRCCADHSWGPVTKLRN